MTRRALNWLITGARGYIGSATTKALAQTKDQVVACGRRDWDIILESAPKPLIGSTKPNVVLHLAAQIGVEKSWADPDIFFKTNVLGTTNVLEYCRKTGSSLVYVSAYTYASSCSDPVSEDSRVSPSNPYAQTKLLAEEICKFYWDAYSVASVIARPFNVFGPDQSSSFLIPMIAQQVKSNKKNIEVRDLSPVRDYIFIADFVDALLLMGERLAIGDLKCGEVFNVGTGAGHSVGEVVQTIQQVWGTNKEVESINQPRKNEIAVSIANIEKITDRLGWHPTYSLEDGLREIFRHERSTAVQCKDKG